MIPVISEQTKFKFGDTVIVKYGFYRGMAGKVTGYVPKTKRFGQTKIEYHIKTVTSSLDIEVEENQIELVGNK